ncbi:ABC-2 family transporter protein [Rubrobacter radiotolerans]|uniref:ABC transporter permease subunit n=1 Tax=Rubrobacter radiotolerans TaxID=42256 RepID=A0A023X6H3_RUBRA|nr:ABC transporter permease subunit [Rubrobacter radiotolerans]AHY47948.1 ABC-2 family transporter protein [Rubrobacter radiotolerans]MDX5892586.1 ABC transporter permease subunit [Rubrobacter radiotolerans]SMC07878.1 ABC-2 type transport system permease protein [Rubrobacter radiotolerans DSM 5868]
MSETAATLRRPSGTLGTLVAHTLRLQLKSVLIWGGVLGTYSAAIVASYLTFGDTEQLDQIMSAYPQELLEAFGITDMSTLEGYLAGQIFNLAPLALAFFPILALSSAIAGSEERGTIDVLLGNPVPRWQVVVASFVATAVSLLAIVAITGALMYGTAVLADLELDFVASVEAVLNLWPISLFFGGLALLCSALFHRRALAIAVPGLVLFAMYLADTLGRISKDLEAYRDFSVFYYYAPEESAIIDGIDWASFAGITALAVLFMLLAVLVFRRRDIYT